MAFLQHENAKAELKTLMPEDAKEATGHGLRAKRSKSGAISFISWKGNRPCGAPVSIGAIAAALARAQSEIANPEKSLTATIRSPFPEWRSDFPLCDAPAGSKLSAKPGQAGNRDRANHLDRRGGTDPLTTVLAHSSGEWLSSDWPVCPVTEVRPPIEMGPHSPMPGVMLFLRW